MNKIIKVGIISIISLSLLIIVCVLIRRNYDKQDASKVVKQFYEDYGRLNKQTIREYVPEELMADEDVAYFLSDENFNTLEDLDYSLRDVKVIGCKKCQNKLAEIKMDYMFDVDLKVLSAYEVEIEYIESYNQNGELKEMNGHQRVICGKVHNKWYILDCFPYKTDEKIDKIAASNTALKFVEGFRDKDVEKIRSEIPEELSKIAGVDSIFDSNAANALAKQDYTINEINSLHTDFYEKSFAKQHISDKFGVDLDITDAYTINIGYILIKGSENISLNRFIICGKVNGRWCVVDANQLLHGINFATEYADSEVGVSDLSSITAILKFDKAESKHGDVPEGMNNDGINGNISINGHVYDIPFCVSDMGDGWSIPEDNNDSDHKKLKPDEYDYSNRYMNAEYPKFAGFLMTTKNMTDSTVSFEESSVVAFHIDLRPTLALSTAFNSFF